MGYEDAAAVAHELLRAVANNDAAAGELSVALAVAVGEALEPHNRLVAAVLAGGPFAVRRALELGELLLASPVPDPLAKPSG